jgi:hypothetical protein
MHRMTAIVLAALIAALGSGALRFAHDGAHASEDARAAALSHDLSGHAAPSTPAPAPHHDDSNCKLHALLSAPLLCAACVTLLIAIGSSVPFPSISPKPLVSRRAPARLDCRGPPACRS